MKPAIAILGVIATLALGGCGEEGVVAQRRVAGGDAERGRARIVAYGCGACHAIEGVPAATGRVGPSLADLADRSYLAGSMRNEPAALMRWIMDPQGVQPGTAMPDLDVDARDARDISAYLYTQRPNLLGPWRLIPARVLTGH